MYVSRQGQSRAWHCVGTHYCIANALGFHAQPLSAPGAELKEASGRLKSVYELQVSTAAGLGVKSEFCMQLSPATHSGRSRVGRKFTLGQSQEAGQCLTTSMQHGCIRGSQRIKLSGSSGRATMGLSWASSHLGLTLAVDLGIRLGSAVLCLLIMSGCELGN